MKILITGANGFIGKQLIKEFRALEEIELYGLSRKKVNSKEIIYINGDVLDLEFLEKIFANHKFDVVIHLAAITAHDEIVNNRFQTLFTNLNGTRNLLEAFNKYCDNSLFFYSSTGKVYGKTCEMPITEEATTCPTNILGKTKDITEKLIDFYTVPKNQYLIARIFNIFGEQQKSNFLLPTIINQLNNDKIYLGNVDDRRDYLYIEDLSKAIVACVKNRSRFSNLDYVNIGSGEAHSVKDILRELEVIVGHKIEIDIDKSKLRTDETDIEYCDNRKLIALTGWKNENTLAMGLQKTCEREGVRIECKR